jgi:ATPase subunit of ABC transporter with duplicated ATPase domains
MRLYLCCLMISNSTPDLIVMDEPTNNLDIANMQILTQTVRQYKGSILLISHDNRFIEEIGVGKVYDMGEVADDELPVSLLPKYRSKVEAIY